MDRHACALVHRLIRSQRPSLRVYRDADEHSILVMDAVLGVVDLGLRPFPARGKQPYRRGFLHTPRGAHAAYRAFAAHPDANVGLLTGDEVRPGEYLFVLDVDPRAGGEGSLARLADVLGPEAFDGTPLVSTGGGGLHVYWTAPFPVRCGVLGPSYPGLDIKGRGGYVLVPPSIHPTTGQHYVTLRGLPLGIAPAPAGLLPLLRGPEPTCPAPVTGPRATTASSAPVWSGEPSALALDLIERFAVPGVHARWDPARRAVGSAVGRGYGDAVIRPALGQWYDHHRAAGRVASTRQEHDREVDRLLRSTRANPRFRRSASEADHRAACRDYPLTEEVVRSIRSGSFIRWDQEGEQGGEPARSKGVTLTNRRLSVGSALPDRDCAFVEAILVQVLHAGWRPGQLVRMTNEQVVEIARDRHPEITWSSAEQVERLKRKYVGRPRDLKPAAVCELLSEVAKGRKARGEDTGTPSVYEVTGLARLVELAGSPR